ncbi:hypothetical protein IU414_06480 [Nocardia farcinica]|uniref:hypothetical protein n=1 Tax=Nocardia farcinica TaxID=37329 RepID=UPI00189519E7|nr:hypothetical protein [Nocardia farcinica]MBF6254426.1 hypothetical protein [Nocardia farcinica]MBF6584405.1 hypothetical protein [Nocardia farcinica]
MQATLTPLVPCLHQALNAAKIDANRKSRHQLHKRTGCKWLRSDLFRADLGNHLAETLPDGWALDHDEREQHRGALVLRSADGYIQARVQRVEADGTIPEARSDRRRIFYRNCDIRQVDLLGQCNHNLILTYQEQAGDLPFAVRAIRPYHVPALMFSIVMPAVADDFLKGRFDVENDTSLEELFGDDTDFGTGTDS